MVLRLQQHTQQPKLPECIAEPQHTHTYQPQTYHLTGSQLNKLPDETRTTKWYYHFVAVLPLAKWYYHFAGKTMIQQSGITNSLGHSFIRKFALFRITGDPCLTFLCCVLSLPH